MKALPVITDPIYAQPTSYSRFERFCLQYINDKRDLRFVHLLATIHLVVVPLAILLYTPLLQGIWWWLVMVCYFYISQIRLRGPFGLMLHNITHRRLFKKSKAGWLQDYVIWLVCPLFGHTPESYFAHHIGMHHVENNSLEDGSSTMPYQRDSIKDFLKYYAKFIAWGAADTFIYLFTRKKKKYYVPFSFGELSFYAFCVGMCFVSFKATLWVYIIPFVFSRLIMMLGNWTQHAFVDPQEPENAYKCTFNCINTKYNHKCWNDGYHLMHHLKPGAHYTEMPKMFMKEKDRIAEQQSFVFADIHYLHLFFYLMTRRYDKMADNLVNVNGTTFSSREEAIALLKKRTQKLLNPAVAEVNAPLVNYAQ
jgi:fatty acid desaturase